MYPRSPIIILLNAYSLHQDPLFFSLIPNSSTSLLLDPDYYESR